MNNWKTLKIEDVCNITSSKRIFYSDYVDSGIPFYRSKEIIEKHKGNEISTELFITQEKYDDIKTKFGVPQKGDMLMTSVGTLGVPYIVKDEVFYFKDGNLTWFKNYTNEIKNKYLYYWFLSSYGKNALNYITIGSTQKALTIKALKDIEISLPPLPTQHRIAAILSSLDDKIENNRRICEKLEEMAQAIFKQWFVEFNFPDEDGLPYKDNGGEMVESEMGLIPKGWECVELSDISSFQNGYAFKSKELLKNKTQNCYDVFKMGHIKRGGGLKKQGTKNYIEIDKCSKLDKYVLKKGDLLMSMTDMKDNVAILGNTALMDEDDRYIVNQRVGLIRSIGKYNIDYPFLYFLTNNISFVSELRSRANRGVQVNLSTEQIKASTIAIPIKNSGILEQFNGSAKAMLEKTFEISMENEKLQQTRDTLLPKLMSGEIDLEEVNEIT